MCTRENGYTDLTLFELGRTPAMYGLPDVLLGADHDGEDDEDDSGVEVVQAVNPVVIVATLETCVGRKAAQYTVKPVDTRKQSNRSTGRSLFKTPNITTQPS
jgi:hypothetical protein